MVHTTSTRHKYLLQEIIEVYRFIVSENDLATLLQGICDRFAARECNDAAWLVLLDHEREEIMTAEAGMEKSFVPIMTQLRAGTLPQCGSKAVSKGVHTAAANCDGTCPLRNVVESCKDCGEVFISLSCRSDLSGFLVLRPSEELALGADELTLLTDLGESIGEALRRLVTVEIARQRENELRLSEERFALALDASQAVLWDWNIKTGAMYTHPDREEFLDYRHGQESLAPLQGIIHPEDSEQVLRVLNDHLAGKTDEYRIEYRISDKKGGWKWYLDRGGVVERDVKDMPIRMTGTHQDITRQKRQEKALALVQEQLHKAVDHEREFLQTVIDGAGDPVMAIDMEFNILLVNVASSRLMQKGMDALQATGQKCYRLFHGAEKPCHDPRFPCPVDEVRKRKCPLTLVHNPFHGNSINNTFEIEVTPLKDDAGNINGIIEVGRDITDRLRIEKELRESRSRLYRLAHHDILTGLPNRLLLRDRLERSISKARRNKSSVALLFLDLDRFKEINDTLGHDVGDDLLVEVAVRLQRLCRHSDTVARLGGDEFVFLLDDLKGRRDAVVVGKKILAALIQPVRLKGHDLHVSTSIGIGIYPEHGGDVDSLMKCADTALYSAKHAGRNTCKMYRPEMLLRTNRLHVLEEELRIAVAEDQFFMEYQPQYDLDTGNLIGLEALLRWQHPKRGVLMPPEFIPLAEESGLLIDMGKLMLPRICQAIVGWQESGLNVVPVAVNISSRQLRDENFLAVISTAVQQSGLAAEFLVIEVSEVTVMDDVERNLAELKQVARFGVRVTVDDFGAGRSSLAYLQKLPINRVKIDHTFIADSVTDPDTGRLVDAIILLAHRLRLVVLAEGVENAEQADFLRRHNCDQAQGFYFARPKREGIIPELLAGSMKTVG